MLGLLTSRIFHKPGGMTDATASRNGAVGAHVYKGNRLETKPEAKKTSSFFPCIRHWRVAIRQLFGLKVATSNRSNKEALSTVGNEKSPKKAAPFQKFGESCTNVPRQVQPARQEQASRSKSERDAIKRSIGEAATASCQIYFDLVDPCLSAHDFTDARSRYATKFESEFATCRMGGRNAEPFSEKASAYIAHASIMSRMEQENPLKFGPGLRESIEVRVLQQFSISAGDLAAIQGGLLKNAAMPISEDCFALVDSVLAVQCPHELTLEEKIALKADYRAKFVSEFVACRSGAEGRRPLPESAAIHSAHKWALACIQQSLPPDSVGELLPAIASAVFKEYRIEKSAVGAAKLWVSDHHGGFVTEHDDPAAANARAAQPVRMK